MPGCVGAAGWGIEREGVAVCVYCKDAAGPAASLQYYYFALPFALPTTSKNCEKIANNS